jgi:biotin-dependent carboxylase-like uncharacterized protein
MSGLSVVRAGPMTTVQDLGRYGHARIGVPVAGALDPVALAEANRAVGNPPAAAGLECVLRGPTLVASTDVAMAVVGAGWAEGPVCVPTGQPFTVPLRHGLRCWVGLSGGIDVPMVLGSRSTDTLGRLGGVDGRPLRDGDELALGPGGDPGEPPAAGPAVPAGSVPLRVLPGPHTGLLQGDLDGAVLTVSPASNRTGIRFAAGPQLAADGRGVTTIGVVPGALQLPPSGLPILLLANCQTTGGYPVVGVVCEEDLRLAAQLRPGTEVVLRAVGGTPSGRAGQAALRP